MGMKLTVLAAGCLLSLNAMAGTMGEVSVPKNQPWLIIGSLGYDWYQNAYNGGPTADPSAQSAIDDGQTPFGRFAIARTFLIYPTVDFGLEVGVQSENTMRLGISQASLDLVGGLPVQTTIKPMLDLLATAAWTPMANVPAFGLVKLGVAYRRMQINDRVTFNDLSEAAFEVQAGIGMDITERASLSVNYQGVFNGSTKYTINPTTFTGNISNIPNQNGILLSLAYTV